MSKDADDGNGVQRQRVAVITLTYNLDTFLLDVGGSCPTTELAKAICLMGADECDNKIREKRMQRALTLAGPEALRALGLPHT